MHTHTNGEELFKSVINWLMREIWKWRTKNIGFGKYFCKDERFFLVSTSQRVAHHISYPLCCVQDAQVCVFPNRVGFFGVQQIYSYNLHNGCSILCLHCPAIFYTTLSLDVIGFCSNANSSFYWFFGNYWNWQVWDLGLCQLAEDRFRVSEGV